MKKKFALLTRGAIACLALGSILLAATGCNQHRRYRQVVEAPVPDKDIPFQTWNIHADSAATISLATGTSLRIPAGAFTNRQGDPVHGTIEFRVREFHDALSLFRSGIPMWSDAGQDGYLRSAGMIEMRARSKDQELELAPGKQIDIALAAYRPAADYSVYYLDEGRQWENKGGFRTDSNRRKPELLAIRDTLPDAPEDPAGDPEDYSIELITNLKENAYLKPFSGVTWKIRKKDMDPATEEALRVGWDKVEVREINKRKMKYELLFTVKLSSGDTKSIEKKARIMARPVLSGRQLADARLAFEKEMTDYELLKTKWEAEEKRLRQECDLLNSFQATKMGIWNIDYLMKRSDLLTVATGFDFEKELDPEINNISLYLLFTRQNSCIRLLPGQWDKVGYDTREDIRLVAVLPGEKLAVVRPETVRKALEGRPQQVTFTTERIPASSFLSIPATNR